MNDDMTVVAAGLKKPLHAGNDFFVHLVHVAGERVARAGPGVGQIDADQRGLRPNPMRRWKPRL